MPAQLNSFTHLRAQLIHSMVSVCVDVLMDTDGAEWRERGGGDAAGFSEAQGL
jgi:hypothetical protein